MLDAVFGKETSNLGGSDALIDVFFLIYTISLNIDKIFFVLGGF